MLYTTDYSRIIFVPAELSGHVILPEGLKIIDSGAFAYRDIQSISLPSTLESIGYFAFGECLKICHL